MIKVVINALGLEIEMRTETGGGKAVIANWLDGL